LSVLKSLIQQEVEVRRIGSFCLNCGYDYADRRDLRPGVVSYECRNCHTTSQEKTQRHHEQGLKKFKQKQKLKKKGRI
jgi:hypothetical protein